MESFTEIYQKRPIEKVKSSILNSRTREQILKVIKNIPKYYFMNDLHYEYYRKYIKPKLSLKYKIRGYNVLYYIALTNHYIVLNIDYRDQFSRSIRNYGYVIGEDHASGKLFVNRANDFLVYQVYLHSDIVLEIGNISVHKASDREVYSILGYDYDIDHDFGSASEIVISSEGRYRVQGEIVIDVFHDHPLEEEFYDFQLPRIITSIYTERLAWLLMHANLNVRIDNNERVVIPEVVDRRDRVEDLCNAVIYTIKAFTGLKRHNNTLYNNEISFDIECTRDRFPFGRQYTDLIVSPVNIKDPRLEQIIMNDIKDQVSRLKPMNERIILGRHIIELKNVIPTRIVYNPPNNLYFGLIDPPSFELDLQSFMVNENSEIVLRHHEHGEITVRFDGDLVNSEPTYIRFITTNVIHDYISEQNRAILYGLLSKIPKPMLEA